MGRGRATPAAEKSPFAVGLGARIKQARERAGLTQRKLSLEAKYDAVQLSRVESGESVPGADAVGRIATVLKTPVAALFGELPNFVIRFDPVEVALHIEARALEGSSADSYQIASRELDQAFQDAGFDIVFSPAKAGWNENLSSRSPERGEAGPVTRLDPARRRRRSADPTLPAASSGAERPSLEEQWLEFRADLRPALLRLADALEQDSPEAQALRRALGGPTPPSSGGRKVQ